MDARDLRFAIVCSCVAVVPGRSEARNELRIDAGETTGGGVAECSLTLRAKVPFQQSGWLAARCWGRPDIPGPRGLTAAHTSPIYVEVGDRRVFRAADAHYLLEVIDDMMAWAEHIGVFRDPQKRVDVVTLFALSKKILHEKLHENEGGGHNHGDSSGPHRH